MFNMFDEQLFVFQSLLKERRRPTGGLSEAMEESLGGGVSTASSPVVRSKTTSGASETGFSSASASLMTELRGSMEERPLGLSS